jgi:hypothetical protein
MSSSQLVQGCENDVKPDTRRLSMEKYASFHGSDLVVETLAYKIRGLWWLTLGEDDVGVGSRQVGTF